MTAISVVLLLIAGFFGGLANSLAGGASLFTFPALLAVGLNPIVANASNAFALLPGNVLGAYGDREKLPKLNYWFFVGLVVALFGGVIGAVALLATPQKLFSTLVPLLIGLASLIFAFSKPIQKFLASLFGGGDSPRLRSVLFAPVSIYGGYFGAGMGVMFMAAIGASSVYELRTANAYKNILGFVTNFSAAMIFIWQGVVSWPETLVMLPAVAAGGFAGGKLIQVLPTEMVRVGIIIIGILMTVIYAYRYWA